jgi:hypothetical protein
MKIRILTWAFNLLLTMLDADIVETNYKNKLKASDIQDVQG